MAQKVTKYLGLPFKENLCRRKHSKCPKLVTLAEDDRNDLGT